MTITYLCRLGSTWRRSCSVATRRNSRRCSGRFPSCTGRARPDYKKENKKKKVHRPLALRWTKWSRAIQFIKYIREVTSSSTPFVGTGWPIDDGKKRRRKPKRGRANSIRVFETKNRIDMTSALFYNPCGLYGREAE